MSDRRIEKNHNKTTVNKNKNTVSIDDLYKMCKKPIGTQNVEENTLNVATEKDSEETYWYIGDDGVVSCATLEDFPLYERRLSVGNIFISKERAEFEVEKYKVLAELKPFSRPFIYGLENYYIYSIGSKSTLSYNYSAYEKRQGELYFKSVKMAERAVNAVGKDRIRKYLFN